MKLFVLHTWHRESCPSELYVRLKSKLMPSEHTIWEAFEAASCGARLVLHHLWEDFLLSLKALLPR